MKALFITFTAIILIFGTALSAEDANRSLLYGKIYLTDGEVLEGFIRWDKNETSWCDILDGNKDLERTRSREYREQKERTGGKRIEIFGLTIYSEDDNVFINYSNEAQSGIRMGHIRTLKPVGNNEVLLELKSGLEVELTGGSGDIGTDNREILVDDNDEGMIELEWDNIDRIEFKETPSMDQTFGKKLYGTVFTRRGEEFSGFICWDKDEAFTKDILDGREDHRKRKIEFGQIESIERITSRAALVVLKNGSRVRLEDSNDIDSGNRGIVISDPNLGAITVDWDEFDMIEFKEPPMALTYDDFDGGKSLRGEVLTVDGEKYKGQIKWDDDEKYTWEILDGEYKRIDFDIEFGFIESIEHASSRGSLVTLKDGRTFRLRNSNDVDANNKGIIVTNGDDEIIIDWEDFDMIKFQD